MEFVRHRSAGGKLPLIVDAGANIGASAMFFALVYPDAKIIAIEPEAGKFALLEKNTAGLDVQCLHAALSSSRGRVKIANPASGNWAFRTKRPRTIPAFHA